MDKVVIEKVVVGMLTNDLIRCLEILSGNSRKVREIFLPIRKEQKADD